MIDTRLLDILCCPATHVPLRKANAEEIAALNRAVASGAAKFEGGAAVDAAIGEALVTRDGRRLYRIDDGIPVLIVDQAIATAQIEGFPAAR